MPLHCAETSYEGRNGNSQHWPPIASALVCTGLMAGTCREVWKNHRRKAEGNGCLSWRPIDCVDWLEPYCTEWYNRGEATGMST